MLARVFIFTPVLKSVQKFADALFKMYVRGQGNDLDVHVRSLFELERTVSLEEKVVLTLDVNDIVNEEFPQLDKLILLGFGQLERVSDVLLRDD